jgi:hypothetical protein|tara:strand:+ start:1613 stop:1726 length:114 start_codon:yes stop_codon:yes gene_type:complete
MVNKYRKTTKIEKKVLKGLGFPIQNKVLIKQKKTNKK